MLKVIADFVKKLVPDDMHVIADFEDQYHFPPYLAHTDLRLDLIIYSKLTKSATLMDLTVCFETNFEEAKSRKEMKYADLVDEIEENGFTVDPRHHRGWCSGISEVRKFPPAKRSAGCRPKGIFHIAIIQSHY